MILIASGSNLKSFIVNSRNCSYSNKSKGYKIVKNGFIELNLDLIRNSIYDSSNIIIVIKKIFGNGKCFTKIDNFVKNIFVSNTLKIEIPKNSTYFSLSTDFSSIGEIGIVSIESYVINKENMSVVKNKKLINKNLPFNIDRKINGDILPKSDFTEFKNNFIKKLYTLEKSQFEPYGEKNNVIDELIDKSEEIINKINSLHIPECDYAVYHYAGIGDTIHSRLLVQQLAQTGKVVWIIPPIASTLYKDDTTVTVMENFSIRFRNPFNKVCLELYSFVDKILKIRYPNIINIGYDFFKHVIDNNNINWKTGHFDCCKMVRDYKIKHNINHNGKVSDLKNLPKKYIVIEYCSMSFQDVKLELYSDLIKKLKSLGIESVYVGSLSDPKLENGIDFRGLPLYDVYTLIKNSIGFVGRNSGNQTVSVYCPDIPVFEVDVTRSLKESEYRDNIYTCDLNDFVELIYGYYNAQKIKERKKYKNTSLKQINEITLYNFAGRGDVINSTCIPRLIKNKYNIFIRICCRSRDKLFFENNPFVDEIYVLDDEEKIKKIAYKENTEWKNIDWWGNEINTWGPSNNLGTMHFSWSSSVGVNRFFNEDIISINDNLLPELFYTKNEIKKVKQFYKNKPYAIIESECFSNQFTNSENILLQLKNKIKNTNLKLYTSNIKDENKIIPPFHSLNDFNLKEIGLLINQCEYFFGICSGMTVICTERTLNRKTKKFVHTTGELPDFYFKDFNFKSIKVGTFIDTVASYINSYKA